MDLNRSLRESPKFVGCFICSLAFKSSARRAMLRWNCQNTLQILINERSMVTFVGTFILLITSVVKNANLKRLRQLARLKYSTVSVNFWHFYIFSVAAVLCREVCIDITWLICSCGDSEKIKMSFSYKKATCHFAVESVVTDICRNGLWRCGTQTPFL